MSTNQNCEFVEFEPGQWIYILENYSAPKNAWDWREHATSYGPFSSYETASAHLLRWHANPGGATINRFASVKRRPPDETLRHLVRDARLR